MTHFHPKLVNQFYPKTPIECHLSNIKFLTSDFIPCIIFNQDIDEPMNNIDVTTENLGKKVCKSMLINLEQAMTNYLFAI